MSHEVMPFVVDTLVLICKPSCWRWRENNGMPFCGRVDYERRTILINRSIHRRKSLNLLDTFIHEDVHRLYPTMSEEGVWKHTGEVLGSINRKTKALLRRHYLSRLQ